MLAMSAGVSAQDAQVLINLAEIEKVNVTAQKRVQDVQDVPISISTLSASTIADLDISDVTQASKLIPNVMMDNTSPFAGSSSILSAYIRGIGQNDFAFNLEPGVGVYVDGVYYARTLGAVVDTLDLDRIDVLKGPQGTLFGKNTIGGAISITSRAPQDIQQMRAELTGGSFGRTDIRVSADIPLSENWLSQVSFSSKQRDGYQDLIDFPGSEAFNTDTGRFNTVNKQRSADDAKGGQDEINGRVKFQYQADEDFTLTLSADFTRVDETALPTTLLQMDVLPGGVLGLYNTCISTPADTLEQLGLGAACGPRATVGSALAGVNIDDNPDNDRLLFTDAFITGSTDVAYKGGSNFSVLDAWGVSAIMEWQLPDQMMLKSITAYRDLESQFGMSTIPSPITGSDISFDMRQDQISQEVQLTGTGFNDALQWATGLYYFHEDGTLLDTVIFGEGLIQIYGLNSLDNESIAAFTHLNYRLNNHWGLTFGARYTHEEKELEGGQRELNQFALKLGFPSFLLPDQSDLTRIYPLGVQTLDFDNFKIKAGAEYYPNEQTMVYLSYSEGFKSGGWTTRLTAPIEENIAPTFDPEEAKSIELGLKAEFWDDSVQLNMAAFATDYSDVQVMASRGLTPYFDNAAQNDIYGFEVESQVLLNNDLYMNLSYGYLDAKFDEVDEDGEIIVGTRQINSPEHSANARLRHYLPLDSGAELISMIGWSFTSQTTNNNLATELLKQSSVAQYDLAVKYVSAEGDWHLTLRGDNLSDEQVIVNGVFSDTYVTTSAVYTAGRTWSLTLGVHY